ncbi:hypothetical protein RI367_000296 [Sorochytrium milnesiophthora]
MSNAAATVAVTEEAEAVPQEAADLVVDAEPFPNVRSTTTEPRKPPSTASGAFKRTGREGALSALRTMKESAIQKPSYKRKYPPPPANDQAAGKDKQNGNGRAAASPRRRQKKPEVTPESNIADIQEFRKLMIAPSVTLELDKVGNAPLPSTGTKLPGAGDTSSDATNNPFFLLCDDVTYAVANFETAMQDFVQWKNEFLKQNVTNAVKLDLTLMLAQVIRSQSDLGQMVMELLRTVRLYSSQWITKYNAIIELEEEHARYDSTVIRKLETMQHQMLRQKSSRMVFMWEYLAKKLIRRKEQELLSRVMSDSDESLFTGPQGLVPDKKRVKEDHAESEAEQQRAVNDMKEKLEQKRKNRERAAAARPSSRQIQEQQLNVLLSEYNSQLPEAMYMHLAGSTHSAMYYASEVLSPAAQRAVSGSRKPRQSRAWTTDDIQALSAPAGLRGLVRSNSSSALDNMRRRAPTTTSKAKYSAIREQALMQTASDGLMKAVKAQMPRKQDRFDEVVFVTGKKAPADQPVVPPAEDNFGNLDMEKTWFTLQDVVELSMLHMQQIRQLQLHYEEKVEQLTSMNAKYHVLPNRVVIQRVRSSSPQSRNAEDAGDSDDHEYRMNLDDDDDDNDDGDNSRIRSPSDGEMPANEAEISTENQAHNVSFLPAIPTSPGAIVQQSPTKRKGRSKGKQSGKRALKNKSPGRTQARASPTRHDAHKPRAKSRTKYVFDRANTPLMYNVNSSLLQLKFMDRLYRLDEEKRKKIAEYSERITRETFESNLLKMVQGRNKMYTPEEVYSLMQQAIPAEFMPLPGRIASATNNSWSMPSSHAAFPARPMATVLERLKAQTTEPTERTSPANKYNIYELVQPLKPVSRPSQSGKQQQQRPISKPEV